MSSGGNEDLADMNSARSIGTNGELDGKLEAAIDYERPKGLL